MQGSTWGHHSYGGLFELDSVVVNREMGPHSVPQADLNALVF